MGYACLRSGIPRAPFCPRRGAIASDARRTACRTYGRLRAADRRNIGRWATPTGRCSRSRQAVARVGTKHDPPESDEQAGRHRLHPPDRRLTGDRAKRNYFCRNPTPSVSASNPPTLIKSSTLGLSTARRAKAIGAQRARFDPFAAAAANVPFLRTADDSCGRCGLWPADASERRRHYAAPRSWDHSHSAATSSHGCGKRLASGHGTPLAAIGPVERFLSCPHFVGFHSRAIRCASAI